jgi:uncharacterized damage-inducible protein DinB
MLQQYGMFADYNLWANALVYDAVSELTDAEFFGATKAPSSVRSTAR